jgi:hypothetical protein
VAGWRRFDVYPGNKKMNIAEVLESGGFKLVTEQIASHQMGSAAAD